MCIACQIKSHLWEREILFLLGIFLLGRQGQGDTRKVLREGRS
jgi:hypothetical protein